MSKRGYRVLTLTLLLLLAFTFSIHIRRINSEPQTIVVPDDFHTIQEAVYNATDGDTIYVREGTYFESLYVNKSVSIIGENKYSTFINASKHLWGRPISIVTNNVTVTGFTLCNSRMEFSYGGIGMYNANSCRIVDNIFTENLDGIYASYSSNNTISNNLFFNNSWNGIHLRDDSRSNVVSGNIILTERNGLLLEFDANNNYILGNYIEGNYIGGDGIDLCACQNTTIVGNNIIRTFTGIYMGESTTKYQTIYHNNLIGNYYQTTIYSNNNEWDDGYPSGGNYWSDYRGTDSNHDGIGDTPYVVDNGYGEFPAEQDDYPLMNPWNTTEFVSISIMPAKTTVGQGYAVEITVSIHYAIKPETFEISVYANTSLIARQNVQTKPNTPALVTLEWNTTGFPYGKYLISITALATSGNTIPTLITQDAVVFVTIPGDVPRLNPGVADGIVNMRDIGEICNKFGKALSGPIEQSLDINNDGIVNMRDIGEACSNFGKHI